MIGPEYQKNATNHPAPIPFAARTAPASVTADEQNDNTMLRSMNELGSLPETDTVFILSAHSTQARVINVRSESIMLVPVNSPSIIPYLGAAGDASASDLRAHQAGGLDEKRLIAQRLGISHAGSCQLKL